jgi:hypothetical protein
MLTWRKSVQKDVVPRPLPLKENTARRSAHGECMATTTVWLLLRFERGTLHG